MQLHCTNIFIMFYRRMWAKQTLVSFLEENLWKPPLKHITKNLKRFVVLETLSLLDIRKFNKGKDDCVKIFSMSSLDLNISLFFLLKIIFYHISYKVLLDILTFQDLKSYQNLFLNLARVEDSQSHTCKLCMINFLISCSFRTNFNNVCETHTLLIQCMYF